MNGYPIFMQIITNLTDRKIKNMNPQNFWFLHYCDVQIILKLMCRPINGRN